MPPSLADGELAQSGEDGRRFEYLVQASEILSSSLEYDQTLAGLARLLVPGLADWCSVDLMDGGGAIKNLTVAHVDPDKVRLAHEMRRRYPPDPHANVGVAQVVRTGEPELYELISDELLVDVATDEEHLQILRDLGLRSAIVAPLSARGRRFGAITLVTAESGRAYGEADVALAVELAKRAGVAIDNARLFEAERTAADRLRLVSDASEVLAHSLDYDASFRKLATLMAERLADLCLIDVLETDGSLRRVITLARDPAKQPLADVIRERAPTGNRRNPIMQAALSGAVRHGDLSDELFQKIALDEEHLRALRGLEVVSYAALPLVARGRILGVLTLASADRYGDETVQLAVELARRAAVALDNTRLFAMRTEMAATLQRSLLPPKLPDIPGVEVASIFHPGGPEAEVGGDFYDLFELAGGSWAAVIGDVCGRGSEAAALTALARYGVRAGAVRGERPATVLRRLNEEVLATGADRFCTIVYATLRIREDHAMLTLARGGHPPPVILRSGGNVQALEPTGRLIGVFPDVTFEDETVRLEAGDSVVFYTDGATERRKHDHHEREWMELIASSAGLTAHQIAARVDRQLMATGPLDDDVAVLVLRFVPEG